MLLGRRALPHTLAALVVVAGAVTLLSARSTGAATITTTDLSGALEPVDLVNTLLGGGISVSNVTYVGDDRAAGSFSGGSSIGGAGLGFDGGIVLTSGLVGDAAGPNDADGESWNHSTPGDADLNALSGFTTEDAAVLEFDFVPTGTSVLFQYVFGSEEYNEYVNSDYNDVFAFFINGANCATVSGPTAPLPVSINTINNGFPYGTMPNSHPELFVNNEIVYDDVTGDPLPTPFDLQLDGFTTVLTCSANVTPGATNHMKLAIADASDGILDSWVFLKAGSFTVPSPTPTNTPTATHTPTITSTPTATGTPTSTATGVPATATHTATATATATAVASTSTHTPTHTPTSASSTPTSTHTSTVTHTPTPTWTSTSTPTPTETSVLPTISATSTATMFVPTHSPTHTATAAPPTATHTPTSTATMFVPTHSPTSTATATATATTVPQGPCERADLNGSGRVTVIDVVEMATHLGAAKKHYDARYDIDADGEVTAKDLVLVVKCRNEEKKKN